MPYPFEPPPPVTIPWQDYAGLQPNDSPSERHWKEVNARRYAEQLQAAARAKPAPPTQEQCDDLMRWALERMTTPEAATEFLLTGGPQQSTHGKQMVDQIIRHLVFQEFSRIAAKHIKAGARK